MSKRYSNLLTFRFQLYVLIRKRLIQWLIVWGAAVLFSLGWWQLRVHRVHAAEERVALMETRYSPLKQMQNENHKISSQLAEMNSHESLLARLDDEQVPYKLLALVSTQVGKRDGTVRVESFKITRTDTVRQVPGPASTGQSHAEETIVLTQLAVRGVAADNLAVSLFVAGLRDTGVFESVDLKSSTGARVDNQRAQTFMIDCWF